MSAPTTDRSAGGETLLAPLPEPAAKPRRWPAFPRPVWAVVLVVLVASGVARGLLVAPRHDALDAVPDTLRVLAAGLVLFGVTGLGVTRLLLPTSLRPHELLWVLPTGSCVTGLTLMALGFGGVPFVPNLILVGVAGLALSVYAVRKHGWPEHGVHADLGWPVLLGALIVAMAVAPMVLKVHFATVTGEGSDGHMAAGAANYLQHGYPTGNDPAQPASFPLVDRSV